jgi:tetratricopeptide (TPR) repeat protein
LSPYSILLFAILLAPPQADRVTFRLITVSSEAKAVELRARILAGESFGSVAMENSTDASASSGGFAGTFAPADLRPELLVALSGLAPGRVSAVGKMGKDFFLVEIVAPAEVEWISENAAAADALKKGRGADAVRSFSKAVQIAEKFGPDDDRLAESLNGLAQAYDLQGDSAGAGSVYRRMLSIRWSPPSNKGNSAVAGLVDRFSDVLSLAYFQGSEFEEALKKYQSALNQTAAGEALYLAMNALLVKAELMPVAEDLMQRAVRAYPGSRRLRYKEAEMYRDAGKMRKALEVFEEASQMKAPASMTPDLDSLQLSFIYQRIGGINTDLTQFDAAIAAYKKALEISPKNADARIALGDVYLRRDQREEARAEYAKMMSAFPDRALPLYRYADACLKIGDFSEAAAAAEKALKIDPQERKARYVRGQALMRMRRIEEGQKELQEYAKQEAAAQAELNSQRDVIVSNRGAADLVLKGRGDEAIALFQSSLKAHPDSESLRLNLGLALSQLGRRQEAVSVFKGMLDGGIGDDFLVYKLLAREYGRLQDEKNTQKYDALYIRKIDTALEDELR